MIDLKQFEKKIYSQNGEDGVIEKIFELIKTTDKFFVEFGVEKGEECNTRYIEEFMKFNGIRFDCDYENINKNIHKEFINADNVIDIFSKHKIPYEFDLLSVDVDFNDFYILKQILNIYTPRVIIVEYNSNFKLEDKIVKYKIDGKWDGTDYFGGSIVSMCKLGNKNGYDLVFADSNGVNLFFIKKSEIGSFDFLNKNDCEKLFVHKNAGYHKPNILKKEFSSYEHES
jgi:hypothetical protein